MLALCASMPAHASQTWFQQPPLTLANTFQVSGAPQPGTFRVIQHQPNPLNSIGNDVPVTWDMTKFTGLKVPRPLSPNETGTVNRGGATGVQIYNNIIGINLNSRDFSATGTPGALVGIMPDYKFPNASYRPFAQAGATVVFSADMQVVTAVRTPPAHNPSYNGQGYVGLDLLFIDTTHPQSIPITVTAQVFAMHGAPPENIGYTDQGGAAS